MNVPKLSAPTRLNQPTRNPRRARPMATLVSAPAMRRWKRSTSANSPLASATNMAMASPKVRISGLEEGMLNLLVIVMLLILLRNLLQLAGQHLGFEAAKHAGAQFSTGSKMA